MVEFLQAAIFLNEIMVFLRVVYLLVSRCNINRKSPEFYS